MNYKLFKSSLIGEFLDKLNQEDSSFTHLYENQEEFLYSFKELDILESNIIVHNDNLGEEMLNTFNSHKNDQQSADFECAKILYENLKLTPAQAGNADFWNYLHHFDMYKYIHQRWKNQGNIETHIKRHWLLNLSSQKHLINFPLTTLWWSIHLTIDETREDKYELSKVYFSNNRFRTVSLGGMSFVRHKPAILSVLQFMKEHREELTKNITYTELGDEISKFINLLGGTKPLSFFDKDWFTEKLKQRFKIQSKNLLSIKEQELLEENKRLKAKLENKDLLNQDESNSIVEEYIRDFLKNNKNFRALEARTLSKKFKNSSINEIKIVINLIEEYFNENNIEDKRSVEAKNVLKKKLLNKSFNFFDDNNKISNEKTQKSIANDLESNEIKSTFDNTKKEKEITYFCLNNKDNPNYMISDTKRDDFDYCIEINGENRNGYLLHFYAEGKIKKTKIDSALLNRNRNQMYSNGKCNNLKLVGIKIISTDFLFGIAYSKNGVTKFKAMDGNDSSIFRNDNNSLHQEGKKIMYVQDYEEIKYKLLPYSIKEDLGTLIQGPLGKGADITNNYYSDKWAVLKPLWNQLTKNEQQELFR